MSNFFANTCACVSAQDTRPGVVTKGCDVLLKQPYITGHTQF